ncbi:hypothetical protein BDV28DRAFT_112880 [Aspergillus coremiiformis]|uniref:Secreted protein n=1 Tax=Aspergillus coremiiformis TaxID=138285 RepID=A0A5N6Z6C8_9EURO|nr:hypothetical protein BDV28DRAFT_112880 [Aspergillus coremiiformis]
MLRHVLLCFSIFFGLLAEARLPQGGITLWTRSIVHSEYLVIMIRALMIKLYIAVRDDSLFASGEMATKYAS